MKIMKALFIIIILSITIPGARSETKKIIKVTSRIDRVMAYQDRALITRTTRLLNMKPGTYEVLFNNLPVLIDDDSVRAKFHRNTNIKILDVEIKTYRLERAPEKKVRHLQDNIQELEDKKREINNRQQVLTLEREYLMGVKNSFLTASNLQIKKQTTVHHASRHKIKDYDQMLNYLTDKFHKNARATHKGEQALREVNKRINFLKVKLRKINKSHSSIPRKKLVTVTVEILKQNSYTLEISYINSRVKWNPGYDIRVFTDMKKTEFVGYGVVKQSSGEDWINSKISFSTAQPAIRGWLPDIIPLYATLSSKIQRPHTKRKFKQKNLTQQAANRALLDNVIITNNEDNDKGEDIDNVSPTISESKKQAGSLVFTVPKRADIPGDGAPHRTAISRQVFPVKFEYISIPKLSPNAYLQAIGRNMMSSPILRGDLNIFMGNNFVGSSYTDNILPGEDFELTLSVNENIRVTRSLEEKEEKKAGFLGSSKKITYTFLVKIENYSGKNIVMNLIDQIPVSDSGDVEIENVSFSHKPELKSKKGIIKWHFKMKSKEKTNISFSFTVSVPKEKDTAFFRTKLPPSVYLQKLPQTAIEDEKDEYQEQKMQKKAPAMRMKMY